MQAGRLAGAWLAAALLVASCAYAQVSGAQKEVFQSNFGAAPLHGYDYAENVATHRQACPFDSSYQSYYLEADDKTFAYLATDLDDLGTAGAKQSYKAAFRIKACQNDWYESGFAAAFSMEDVSPNGATKGNGKTTGAFANSVKAWFKEDGNNWELRLVQVVNGQETTLVRSSTEKSNYHQLYYLVVDNRLTTGPRLQLFDGNGALIQETTTDPSFKGKAVHNLWFVAYGFSYLERDTYLVAEPPSTKIYDTDPRAPLVKSMDINPEVVGPNQPVQVTALVEDDWGVSSVNVIYRVNAGGNQVASMTNGGAGATYTGTIPGQAAGSTVYYRVEATDTTGLVGHSANQPHYTVGSGQPVDETPGNPEQPPPAGGGDVDEGGGFEVGVALAVLLVSVAGIFAGRMADLYGYKRLAFLLAAGGIFGALAWGAWEVNLGHVQEKVKAFPAATWYALAATGALGAAFAYLAKRRLRRTAP